MSRCGTCGTEPAIADGLCAKCYQARISALAEAAKQKGAADRLPSSNNHLGLRIIANICLVLAWFFGALVVFVAAATSTPGRAFAIFLGGTLQAVMLWAIGRIIQVLLDTEQSVRACHSGISQVLDRLDKSAAGNSEKDNAH